MLSTLNFIREMLPSTSLFAAALTALLAVRTFRHQQIEKQKIEVCEEFHDRSHKVLRSIDNARNPWGAENEPGFQEWTKKNGVESDARKRTGLSTLYRMEATGEAIKLLYERRFVAAGYLGDGVLETTDAITQVAKEVKVAAEVLSFTEDNSPDHETRIRFQKIIWPMAATREEDEIVMRLENMARKINAITRPILRPPSFSETMQAKLDFGHLVGGQAAERTDQLG